MAKRILVVDDEKDCCSFINDYLAKRGYSVDVAYDGIQAKEMLDKNSYDCIFFDCNMPELTGIELVSVINKKNPHARKVMISGYEGVDENFAKKIGIDAFLSKPVILRDLETAIGA
ncbi:MAG: response regulator [Candidatus Omnitrophota bacterium]